MLYSNYFAVITITVLYNLIRSSLQFNLDLTTYKQHYGTEGSMFGFSIALHRYINRNWVIVGAPKAQQSQNFSIYERLQEPGAVFRCDVQDTNRCMSIPFDPHPQNRNERGEYTDTKSFQWLGATVTSNNDDGPVLACAPRYVYHTSQPSRIARIEPVGTCFAASPNFTSFQELAPCRNSNWGYHRQGSCQAGFSAAVSKNGKRLFIGAPGSWYWQGQVYSYDTNDRRLPPFQTRESPTSLDDDSYLGYSMASGDFNGDGEGDIAVGMPRGEGLLGKVVLYRQSLQIIRNITGPHLGSYFGYAIATADIDGDKLDDLIIGAPMWAEKNNEGKYDVGRVYILLQGVNHEYESKDVLTGLRSKSRFGTALTNLGDINQDGYGDFAVGAPYDGEYGRGAVYIYHGSKILPLKKYAQVIYAENIEYNRIPRTFGFSLAGGLDMDGNLYPDLAVGAYDSDMVFVFKARPVAVVDASVKFVGNSKLIDLENKNCVDEITGIKNLACSVIKTCIKYEGVNLPPVQDFFVTYTLDSKHLKSPRMYFFRENGNVRNKTVRLEYGKQTCDEQTVYISNNVRDKLTPLEVEMTYKIVEQPLYRERRQILTPVVDQSRETIQRDALNIQKNCGPDNVCIPDLIADIITVDKYLLGENVPLTINVTIVNKGEDAFEAAFYMTISPYLHYNKVIRPDTVESRQTPITCTAPSIKNNNVLKCEIGNPFGADKVAEFSVVLIPSSLLHTLPTYDFYMEVNSTNPEKEGSTFDNIIHKSINVWVQSDLVIEGFSRNDSAHYNASEFKEFSDAVSENDLGPHLVHFYNIRNDGPSTINEAVVNIYWPVETITGKPLMYIMNKPTTSGNIQCQPNGLINTKGLEYDQYHATKNYLELTGVITRDKFHAEENKFLETNFETKILDDSKFDSGDGSLIHSERANAHKESHSSGGGGSTSSSSWSSSSSSSSSGGGSGGGYHSTSSYHSGPATSEIHVSSSVPVQVSRVSSSGSGSGASHGSGSTAYHQSSSFGGGSGTGGGEIHVSSSVPVHITSQHGSSHGSNSGSAHGSSSGYSQGSNYNQGQIGGGNYAQNSVYGSAHGGNAGQSSSGYSSETHHTGPTYYSSSSYNSGPIHSQSYSSGPIHSSSYSQQYGGGSQGANQNYNQGGIYSGHNVNYDENLQSIDPNQQRHRRHRRDGTTEQPSGFCQHVKCAAFKCVVNDLKNNEGVWFIMRGRLVAKTLHSLAETAPINISTMAIAQVTNLPYIGKPTENIIKNHEVYFTAIPEPIPTSDMVPLWVVVLSACAGALILLLLIFLLYKCGFFKRNRPMNHAQQQERRPLKSNGYHSDEHL